MTTSTPSPKRLLRKSALKALPCAEQDALLTVQDVAELDRVSVKTVRRAIARGDLPVLRIGLGGRMIRITRAAHLAYRQSWSL